MITENTEDIQYGVVSIITPIYNGEKYVSETIESVFAQTYLHWEMLIIDDGSTDNGPEIIKNYILKDNRIQLFQQKNAGSASVRNNGIRHAKGQYIALLDADDLWETDFLEKQIRLLKEKDAVLVYSSYKMINERSEEFLKPIIVLPSITYKQMLWAKCIHSPTGVYDRTKYGTIYLREELKSLRDDFAYWLDIIKLSGVAYGNQEVLGRYRITKSSTTGKKIKLIMIQYNFYKRYLNFGCFRSIAYTFYWGISGLMKYNRKL
jgi:glycosyltransferase involved in cell wall biosynthesis